MTDKTTVNSQITDAVTQSNVKVMGEAPAMAMGSIYQSLAHSTGLLFENAVAAQQQQAILAQAATNLGVMQLYSMSAAEAGKIGQSDVPDNLLSLLAALRVATGPVADATADKAPVAEPPPAESKTGPAA